ncbi:MAG: hypothetical protein JWQ19_2701 [Subtercola sp.]|nr:hypothetical protein [Subtercola sp.]
MPLSVSRVADASASASAAHSVDPDSTPATRQLRVCVVGHVCIDENTADSGDVLRSAGSPAVFIAHQLAEFTGVSTTVLAPRGTDFDPLAPEISFFGAARGDTTLVYRNSFIDGVRHQQCLYTDSAVPKPIELHTAKLMRESDVVIVAPLLSNLAPAYLNDVFENVAASAMRLLLPQGYMRRVDTDHVVHEREFTEWAQVLPHFDVVVFSDEDCTDALDTARGWSRALPHTAIVVTQNRRGATIFERGRSRQVAAAPIAAVDSVATIGAGDVFSAHLALGLAGRRDLDVAVANANNAAASFIEAANVRASARDESSQLV